MTPSFRCSLALAVSATLAASGAARAQDFFRDFGTSRSSGGIGPVVPSDYTYQDATPSGLQPVTPPDESGYEEKYNFASGPVRFSVAAGAGLEFNDNINLSEDNRDSDLIFRPSLNIDASWKLSELNTLRFGLGLSYAKYFDHSEYDTNGILISPTSELALSFGLGAFKITVRDRGSYQEDTFDVPQLGGVAQYRRAENQAGIEADWGLNQYTTLVFGYDHYNLWTFDDQFSAEQRAIDTVFVKPEFQITPTIKVGAVATYSWINFDEETRADGHNILAGPFIEWKASEFLTVYAEAGVQDLTFDGTSSFDDEFFQDLTNDERRLFRDNDSSSTWYAKLELEHRASDTFSERISGSKTSEVGIGTNFYDLYHVEYSADWRGFLANTELSPTVFYEYYETSGALGEEAHRVGAAIAIRHNLTNSITVGLDYRFIIRDSNLENADYYQNLAFVSVYYKF